MRERIRDGTAGRCSHCRYLGLSTGSQYEWPCPILKDFICETHCAEVQVKGGIETRKSVAKQIAWPHDTEALRNYCRDCPFGDLIHLE